MSEHQATRTLVKSPPELWAECSDARSLARHLGDAVGEIRIKRLEPETTVAWEGEHVRGTVRLEPSGWGTRVTLTAAAEPREVVATPQPEVVEAPGPVAAPPPEPVADPVPELRVPDPARAGLVVRMRRWFMPEPASATPSSEPVAAPPPATDPAPSSAPPEPPEAAVPAEPATNSVDLTAALDSLGKAHHRPFSRA